MIKLTARNRTWLNSLLMNATLRSLYLAQQETNLIEDVLSEDEYTDSEQIRLNSIVEYYRIKIKDASYPLILSTDIR